MTTLNSIKESISKLVTPLLNTKTLIILGVIILMRVITIGVMIYMNDGYSSTFFSDCFSLLAKMLFLIMPVVLLTLKLMSNLIKKLMPNAQENTQMVVQVVIMVLAMESFMTFNTAMNSIGFADIHTFIEVWIHDLLTALPVSMTTMLIMALAIKPRIKKFLGIDKQRTA